MNIVSALKREEKKLARQAERIERQIERLRAAAKALGGAVNGRKKTKRHMSPSARERIARAQRRRWAKIRAAEKAA
jgi:hypothetical protein